NVEKSMVRRAVLWREPGSIHAEDHGQVLQGGVVYDAIISALQKGGINSANGVKTHRCHAAGEQHGMLFSDPDIVVAVRHHFFQKLQTRPSRHSGRDAHDSAVFLAKFDHGLSEYILPIRRSAGLSWKCGPSRHVVRTQAMEFFWIAQRGFEALAFLAQDMNDPGLIISLGKLQSANEQRQVVPVDRSKIAESHLLKNQAAA